MGFIEGLVYIVIAFWVYNIGLYIGKQLVQREEEQNHTYTSTSYDPWDDWDFGESETTKSVKPKAKKSKKK